MWCSKSSQQWENFFDIIVLQFVGHPPGGYEILFHFIVIVSLLPSSYGFFFIFGHGYLFLGRFQHSADGCSIASCHFGALAGGDKCMSFYYAILNWKFLSALILSLRTTNMHPFALLLWFFLFLLLYYLWGICS